MPIVPYKAMTVLSMDDNVIHPPEHEFIFGSDPTPDDCPKPSEPMASKDGRPSRVIQERADRPKRESKGWWHKAMWFVLSSALAAPVGYLAWELVFWIVEMWR